jgi:hypothetical protein
VAPGMAAPVLSVTVPRMSPEFVLWAEVGVGTTTHNAVSRAVADKMNFIRSS